MKKVDKIKESEGFYKEIFENAIDAIFIADAKTGILIDCNSAASKLVGRKRSEMIGKHQRILHPKEESKGEFSKTFKQHLKEKKRQVLKTKIITKKGEIRNVAIKANIFELGDRKILTGIFRDITEQREIEDKLKESEEMLSTIFYSARDPTLLMDRAGKILRVNKAISKVGNFTEKELVGKNFASFKTVSPKTLVKLMVIYSKILKGIEVPAFEIEFKTKKGMLSFELKGSPIRKDEKVVGVLAVLRDITDRKRAEESLKSKVEYLEKFTKIAVGRELQMIELKKRLRELENKAKKS